MKVCKTIKTGQHGFSIYAFAANFFHMNYFTGSGFTVNLLSLIFFRENGSSAKQCIAVQNTLSPGTLSEAIQRPNENSFGASGSWAEPCFACPTLRCGGFAYPPGILIAIFNK
jgi:hypothetical protein